jgi:hypothetical protein
VFQRDRLCCVRWGQTEDRYAELDAGCAVHALACVDDAADENAAVVACSIFAIDAASAVAAAAALIRVDVQSERGAGTATAPAQGARGAARGREYSTRGFAIAAKNEERHVERAGHRHQHQPLIQEHSTAGVGRADGSVTGYATGLRDEGVEASASRRKLACGWMGSYGLVHSEYDVCLSPETCLRPVLRARRSSPNHSDPVCLRMASTAAAKVALTEAP